MDQLEERAREAMAALEPRRARQRIPDETRAAVLAFARARRSDGVGWAEIATAVGLSVSVLIRWMSSKPRRARRLVPVNITRNQAKAPVCAAPVLVAGSYRVEGLDVAGVAELLRCLV